MQTTRSPLLNADGSLNYKRIDEAAAQARSEALSAMVAGMLARLLALGSRLTTRHGPCAHSG
jgi:hypothetical protein